MCKINRYLKGVIKFVPQFIIEFKIIEKIDAENVYFNEHVVSWDT